MQDTLQNIAPPAWQAADAAHVWHPFTPMADKAPLPVVRAEGVWLELADGRRILDGISSWWVNLHGHSHPYLAEAIARQARTLEHVVFAGCTHEPAARIAQRLVQLLPGQMRKAFFSDNGSTAVEVALKMALQYFWNRGERRGKVVALEGAYHGDTFGAMSVGGRTAFSEPFERHLFHTVYLPFPQKDNAPQVLAAMRQALDTGEVAAFIYEPLLQGAGGMRTYAPNVLSDLIHAAQAAGALCIADEVMTGFGRTGRLFASEYAAAPDIFCLSKGLTGGAMAMGLTLCNQKTFAPFDTGDKAKTFFHGHSFTANPMACAVANASLDLLLADECQAAIARIRARHLAFGQQIADHPSARAVRKLGTLLAIELETPEASSYFAEGRDFIYKFFLERNLLLRPLGNTLYVLPPYVIADEELDLIYAAIAQLLDAWPTHA